MAQSTLGHVELSPRQGEKKNGIDEKAPTPEFASTYFLPKLIMIGPTL